MSYSLFFRDGIIFYIAVPGELPKRQEVFLKFGSTAKKLVG
jgi:hypothetical protein